MPKDPSFATTDAATTAPDEAHARPRSHSNPRSRSNSPSQSHRSQQPLMDIDVPLQLTPSVERGFTTHIMSSQSSSENGKKKRGSSRFDGNDWRKYMRPAKKEDNMNVSSMFSWTSRTSIGHEQIVQTREVTQEVEVVPPTQSRWVLSKPKRVSRG